MHDFPIELEKCWLRISLKVKVEVKIRKSIALGTNERSEIRQRIPNVHKAFEQQAFYGSNDCSMHAWNCHYQLAPLFNYLNCNQTMAVNALPTLFRVICEFGESSRDQRTRWAENNLMAAGSTVYSRKKLFYLFSKFTRNCFETLPFWSPLKFVLAWLTNHKSEFWYLINVLTTLSFTQIACSALIISKDSSLISASDK